MTVILTQDERNDVIDGIMRSIRATDTVHRLFSDPEARRRLVDYAEIADELGYDEPLRESYPLERSVPALRRVLALWRDVAETWLNSDTELTEQELYRRRSGVGVRRFSTGSGDNLWASS